MAIVIVTLPKKTSTADPAEPSLGYELEKKVAKKGPGNTNHPVPTGKFKKVSKK